MSGTRQDLLTCAKLFELAPGKEFSDLLMQGFEQAFKGRSLATLPPELIAALAKAGGGSLTLGLRQGKPEALEQALAAVGDDATDAAKRIEYVQIFGEVDQPECVPVLLALLGGTGNDELRKAALTSLGRYSDPRIGSDVVGLYPSLPAEVQDVARTLLVSRRPWTLELLNAVAAGRIAADAIPAADVRKMTVHDDEQIAGLVRRHWGDIEGASTAEMQQEIQRLSAVLASGSGNPYPGKQIYAESCGKCHLLFGDGGRIGPDLTTYQRKDQLALLINVVNPSAEVREGFESWLVVTLDGRTASGFLYDQDNQVVILRGADGQNVTIARDDIDEMVKQPRSLMPEGLLKTFTDQQVRDLLAYLKSSQPLNN
jgi:putative heme-binding domain-containing protein